MQTPQRSESLLYLNDVLEQLNENEIAVLNLALMRLPSDEFLPEATHTLSGHTSSVYCMAVLPDGRIISGSNDKTLRVWDAESGQCLNTLSGHTSYVSCVAVLPDGRIISGSNDETLRVWDTESGQCLKTLNGYSGPVYCVAVLPDGRIISGSYDKTLRVWDVRRGLSLNVRIDEEAVEEIVSVGNCHIN